VPKELFEIKAFESGNIYNADDRDIPDDAAVYSENIDPYGQSGSLMAIQSDATAIKSAVDAKRMAMINNNGTHQLTYIDNSDGYLKQIADVYTGNPAISDLDASNLGAGTIPAMQTNNKEVHIGLGQSKDVKWVGNIPHSQFGGSVPSGLQSEKAELTAPSPFPNMHAVVNNATNTYVYGIQQNGNYVYKFDVSIGVLVRRSEYFFSETEAICLASDGNLWVADIANSNFTIIKIDPDNMDVITSRVVTGTTGVTDMMQCGNTLWLARGNTSTSQCLWNVSVTNLDTNSSSTSANNKYLYEGVNQSSNTSQGDWSTSPGQKIEVDIHTPKLPLIRVTGSNSYVGIATYVEPSDAGTYAKFNYDDDDNDFIGGGVVAGSSSVTGNIKWFCHVVKDTYASGTKMDDFADDGRVLAFSQDFNQTHDKVYLVKQDTNTTYLNWVQEGSSTSVSQLYRQNKIAYNHAKNTVIDNNRVAVATNIDVEDAILDETSNSYNVFSGAGQIRWASGASGSLGIKAEGEVKLTFTVNNSVSGTLDTTKDHFYATSFTYDGYQESPLSSWELRNNSSDGTAGINVKMDIFVSNLGKRVTHINLYRSSTTSALAQQPSGFFRLVKSVSLKSGWLTTDSSTTNPNWGNYYSKTITDSGVSYASYEARTGISEALTTTLPKYGLSAKVNNFLYITDCSHADIDDATNYLFKSRPFNYDQFNWARDFLLLPNKATAMESFNGRLYVFSENETYVVNPDGMYIEDTIKGIGCRNQNGVVSSEIGMCFIDKNSIYLHSGQGINDIGAKIKKAHQIDDTYNSYSSLEKLCNYSTDDYSGDIVATYDSHRKAFCFFYTYKYIVPTTFTHDCNLSSGVEYITHLENTNIVQGLLVSGTGIPEGGNIVNIDNSTRFELNKVVTASGTHTLTFTLNTTHYVPQCLVYTMPKNRWDVWNRTNSSATTDFNTYGAVHGKNNELLVSDTDNGLIQPFDPKSSTRLDNFKWYSKKFTMGDSTADKKLYKVEILSEDNSPTITVNTAENSTSYTALSNKKISRHAQVKIAVTGDSSATIDALRLVFRRLRRTKAMT
tara:strand:- start:11994 stop:15197 length:3204 start_codon:yes stop_codon:yes gene_type:complete